MIRAECQRLGTTPGHFVSRVVLTRYFSCSETNRLTELKSSERPHLIRRLEARARLWGLWRPCFCWRDERSEEPSRVLLQSLTPEFQRDEDDLRRWVKLWA